MPAAVPVVEPVVEVVRLTVPLVLVAAEFVVPLVVAVPVVLLT